MLRREEVEKRIEEWWLACVAAGNARAVCEAAEREANRLLVRAVVAVLREVSDGAA
jgi:hypothetical protein